MSPRRHEIDIRFPTAMGTTQVRFAVPEGPLPLVALVPLAQALTSTLAEKAAEREVEDGRTISCRAGCAACCRQLIPLSIPEAFALADTVIGFEEARRDDVLTRFEGLETRVLAHGLLGELDAAARGDETPAAQVGFRYLALGEPCVFLEAESCSIYADRPTACRDYLVTSPASHCASQGKLPIAKVKTPVLLSEVLARVTARLLDQPPVVVPMPVAMRWVEAHAELGVRTWPALEMLSILLEELGVPLPHKGLR